MCGKPGHIALKCYKRFDISFTGPDSSNVTASPHAFTAASSTTSVSDSGWYFNSRATNHITVDLENLALKFDYLGSKKFDLGSGSMLSISYIGSSTLPCTDTSISLLLINILFVPQITKNLLGISQFTRDNNVPN